MARTAAIRGLNDGPCFVLQHAGVERTCVWHLSSQTSDGAGAGADTSLTSASRDLEDGDAMSYRCKGTRVRAKRDHLAHSANGGRVRDHVRILVLASTDSMGCLCMKLVGPAWVGVPCMGRSSTRRRTCCVAKTKACGRPDAVTAPRASFSAAISATRVAVAGHTSSTYRPEQRSALKS